MQFNMIAGRTPQGVRGLKPHGTFTFTFTFPSHSARSAWIETIHYHGGKWLFAVALRKECVD